MAVFPFKELRVSPMGGATTMSVAVKRQLAQAIWRVIRHQRLSQREAAGVLGVDQPTISHIACGRIERFSLDRLLRLLGMLDRDIVIVIAPRKPFRNRPAVRLKVHFAGRRHRARQRF